jgi:hypothetical protein
MAYSARVYRVLIASPSDVPQERDIAVRVIQEWNDLNSAERQIVILPLKWETHSAPEFGKRPQDVINRQVVDLCDLVVGVFWTRIGSPTGKADSGTLEEIERVAKEGKKVMLYFSRVKQDPDGLDLDQLAKLREFKQRISPKALVETYSDQIEFHDKLAKQLEIQLRELVVQEGGGVSDTSTPLTDIRLRLVHPSTNDVKERLELETTHITIADFGEIPDYALPTKQTKQKTDSLIFLGPTPNADYYRDYSSYIVQQNLLVPIRFWLRNEGQIGARDVYVKLAIRSSAKNLVLVTSESIRRSPPSETSDVYTFQTSRHVRPDELLATASEIWYRELELRALQPKREMTTAASFHLGALSDTTAEVVADIYADTLPEPVSQRLTIDFKVNDMKATAKQLVSLITSSSQERPVFSVVTK